MSAKITSYFSPVTPEQAAEQTSRQFELIRHEIRVKKAQQVLKEANKSRQRTQDGTQRQRRRRQRIKENEVQLGLRNPVTLCKIKVMQLRQASEPPDTGIPSNSRAKRTNPYEPTRWAIIEASRKRVGLKSPQASVKDLQKGPSGALFKTLDRGTVKRSINKDATDWTPEVYARVALAEKAHQALRSQLVVQEGKKVGPARLDRYPGLANKIVNVLILTTTVSSEDRGCNNRHNETKDPFPTHLVAKPRPTALRTSVYGVPAEAVGGHGLRTHHARPISPLDNGLRASSMGSLLENPVANLVFDSA